MPSAFDAPAVVVEHLSVRYRRRMQAPTGSGGPLRRRRVVRPVEALRDVSFAVPRGITFAVVGENGAGKSTLLRTIAGNLAPTEGRVTVRGRTTPLLARGVGFSRELTGRQNLLLGGLAAGLDIDEARRLIPLVEEFAELGDFMDSPLRTYSTGMNSRLAFSLAVHLDPQILLIDEGLSAGDARFKVKTLTKMRELCGEDRAVVLVTHAMGVVRDWADQAMWLHQGTVRTVGRPADVVEEYLVHQGVRETAVVDEDV